MSAYFLNGITAFPPGAAIAEHFHNCDESVLIIRGSALAHIDGTQYPVAFGETSFIPAGIPPHKMLSADAAGAEDRLAMTRLMGEQIAALRQWAQGRARPATSPQSGGNTRKIAA